jgi:cation transport ATPase
MSLGILYKDAEALQKAKDINCVLLDKTATLTVGTPKVTDLQILQGERETLLAIAKGMETHSNHPIAECIVAFAEEVEGVEISEYTYTMGKGATGKIGGKSYVLGNRKLLQKDFQ